MKKGNTANTETAALSRQYYTILVFMALSAVLGSLLLLPKPFDLLPFVIVIGLAFLFVSSRYPMIGVVVYMILFFIRPQELFPGISAFSYPYERIVAIMVVVNLIMEHAVNGKKIKLFEMDKAVVGVLAATCLSIFTSIWVGQSWLSFQNLFKIIVVYFFLTRIIDSEDKFQWIIWLYAIAIGFIAISSMINYYTGHVLKVMGIERAVGIGDEGSAYGDPNTMAATLVLGIPFIYYLAKSYRSVLVKTLLFGLIGFTLWTIILTGSRGGMLGATVILFLMGWNSRHKMISVIAVVLVVIMALAVMPAQYIKRLTSIGDYNDTRDVTGAAESAQGRIRGFLVGLEILTKRPLAGVGIGCFGIYNHEFHNSYLNAHNLMGQLMGETGLAGLATFAFLIYMLTKYIRHIRWLYRKRRWQPDLSYYTVMPVMIALLGLLFLGLFGHNAWRPNWYIYACFLVIVMNLVGNRARKEDEQAQNPLLPSRESETEAATTVAL